MPKALPTLTEPYKTTNELGLILAVVFAAEAVFLLVGMQFSQETYLLFLNKLYLFSIFGFWLSLGCVGITLLFFPEHTGTLVKYLTVPFMATLLLCSFLG